MFSSSRQLGHQNSPEIIHDRLPGQTAFVDRQPWQTVQSQERGVQTSGLPSLELVSPPTAHLRTNQQKRLFAYCRERKSFISTHAILSRELGIPYGTVRGILRRLKLLGLLAVIPYFQGAIQGLHIMSMEEGKSFTPPSSPSCLFNPDTPVPPSTYREIDQKQIYPSLQFGRQTPRLCGSFGRSPLRVD